MASNVNSGVPSAGIENIRREDEKSKFRIKKPRSLYDGIYTFWYRILVICVCIIPSWLIVIILGAFNDFLIEPWMVIIGTAISIIPLFTSEIIRQHVFDRIIKLDHKGHRRRSTEIKKRSALSQTHTILLSSRKVSLGRKGSSFYSLIGKRVMDLVIALLVLPVMLPVIYFIAAVIISFGGTAFSRTVLLDKDGNPFPAYKFRTITNSPNDALEKYLSSNPADRAAWNENENLHNDPRITSLGRFLRKSSLDNLPLLFNVLYGQMSMVGPKPLRVHSDKRIQDYYKGMKPGILDPNRVFISNYAEIYDKPEVYKKHSVGSSFKTDIYAIISHLASVIFYK